ncbi:MAG: hypothetical protein ABI599_00010 [Flavobacteriales bacterium]
MPTTLSQAQWKTQDTEPPPQGVQPKTGSDGHGCIWSVVGESPDGSVLVFAVVGLLPDVNKQPFAGGDIVEAPMLPLPSPVPVFVQVNAAYSGESNPLNWTVQASSIGGTPVTFVRGNGGM